MKCECGNIARVGWPGMTCVCCESPRSGGSLEWAGGLVGLRAGEPPGKSPLPFPLQLPRLLLYLPLLPLILFHISSCNFLQNSFLWLLSIWKAYSISTSNNLSSFFFAFAQRRREDLSSFQSRSNRQSQQGVGNPTAAALALLARRGSSRTCRRRTHGVAGDGAPSSHRQPNLTSHTWAPLDSYGV